VCPQVGLVYRIWPARRVVMGLCVSKFLRASLVLCPNVVIHVRLYADVC
jgi:hypothetical protein